jgi:hypothetical protein
LLIKKAELTKEVFLGSPASPMFIFKLRDTISQEKYLARELLHLKIYTKISQLFPGINGIGDRNEVNDAREKDGNSSGKSGEAEGQTDY